MNRKRVFVEKKSGVPSLYQKFAITIILVGLLPMMLLSIFITNNMMKDYKKTLSIHYEHTAEYVLNSLESMLDSYNNISQMTYYYNRSSYENSYALYMYFDEFRQIVYGEIYDSETMEKERKAELDFFLRYLGSMDNHIDGTHFMAEDLQGNRLNFHYGTNGTYFMDQTLFEDLIDYEKMDKATKKLILIPPHGNAYFNGVEKQVMTVGRNYFDLRGNVGSEVYVGTLFLDINLRKVHSLFSEVNFEGNEIFYVVNEGGDCFYSNENDKIGINLSNYLKSLESTDKQLVISTDANEYGLRVVVLMDTEKTFQNIRQTQQMIYAVIGMSALVLLLGSLFFSKRLTKPIREMMNQMEQIETGNFDIELPVYAKDEVGILADRFNQMSSALKTYINKSYVAQIRQNEAELTALKSQIYPHFLYNTLEIIRMTALEDGENKVLEMIEALSEQIHYLIGPMQDMVPLEKEIDIVKKYIYLLNCRIAGKVQLKLNTSETAKRVVPKLILQPIVENAYVHGLKPKKGNGTIMIETIENAKGLEIRVMDNGTGMDEDALKRIHMLLEGNELGIKNEYNWQSIGLKNVHDRIRFLYGEGYGIEVTSTPGIGTMVRIVMPLKDEEEKEQA